MKFKDIVNRDSVNLTNCEQEPIHIPGSIQPHGFLLGLDDNFTITYCSENSSKYINLDYKQLLGKNFGVFGEEKLIRLRHYIDNGNMLSSKLLKLEFENNMFLCTVHKNNTNYIIEAEPVEETKQLPYEIYDNTSQFLSYMHDTHTFKELCQLVAEGTRKITGYDRVMIYRFDKEYNGEVFAESLREDLEPFLGLHYPHTDIPKQARELYMQNLLRLISDVNYTPVPIYTIDNGEEKNLDLSLSVLRSTSPIHVQYLHNMGVGATLTISLVHQKKLWGLIACHHYSPKNLSPELRMAAKLQGHFITSQIELRQSNEEYEITRKVTAAFDTVNKIQLNGKEESFRDLIQNPALLKLSNAAGVSILFDGEIYKQGHTPSNDQIHYMANWLAAYSSNTHFATNRMIDYLPDDKEFCSHTSGLLYYSLDVDSNNCIIWYRPETKTEVYWAGDPTKSIEKDEKGLSPRKSFAQWQQLVECTAKEWLEPELDAAAAYASSLQRQINYIIIKKEEEKYRKLSELLKETNSELENINWISTHDLQEPLRKIQLISSRILIKDEQMSEGVQEAIKRMNLSANRMQSLLIDILQYTRLKHINDSFEDVSLNQVIDDVKADLAETFHETYAELITDELPVIKGIPFLLRQLFSNIISNAIKYSSEGKKPVIKVTVDNKPRQFKSDSQQLYTVIHVSDNGIGFESKYVESIFNIFTKLHPASEYKGSGVGLALCKKIMQNHNGHISAASGKEGGAVFSIYFPQ